MSSACLFCQPERSRIAFENDQLIGLWDAFPVSPGHLLVIPRRHIPTWFDATPEEQVGLLKGIEMARQVITDRHAPAGFNIGINVGETAGQTVFHLHIHVIPRYSGDLPDPRGGVRNVIPSKGNYLRQPVAAGQILAEVPHHRSLIRGSGEDPLLPHILAYIDRAAAADLCVAFVRTGGLVLVQEHLRELLERGGKVRILAGDYLDITEPEALLGLLDLGGNLDLRVFEADRISFHPKGYLFHFVDGTSIAVIGSSNLSASALREGIEWNYRVLTSADPKGIAQVQETFDQLFQHPSTQPVTTDWIREYRERRRPPKRSSEILITDRTVVETVPEPHSIQKEALEALQNTRLAGNSAGLVVLATGLGKTWLSAFDSHRPEFGRVLFVAHREEILTQALRTFRKIRPTALLGRYTGTEKIPDAEVLFASIQTLGRQSHLKAFRPDRFDYIVVDEFHHAAAATYRNLITHFTPKFLLGLTATPERTDGGDLLGLCQENLVFRCDVSRGIREGLLVPFQYFGVPDEVDYQNIPWRNNRFDEVELTRAVATEKRALNALEQYRERAGRRTIAFCCSQRHSDFMADFFSRHGCRSVSVHSGENSAPRTASLEALEAGEIDIVCAVDMFNEGVDIPSIDTVMMLRPTESVILWMQQFGRGLRKSDDKPHLAVIDYIGNHRTFLNKPRALLNIKDGDRHIEEALNLLLANRADLPPGCEVTYDLKAIDILRSLLRSPANGEALNSFYLDFRERHGQRPTALELFHAGFTPRALRQSHGSWFRYVQEMGDASPVFREVLDQGIEFLIEMETTRMTKSFKILVILALLNEDALPGSISIDTLANAFRRLSERSAKLRHDVGQALLKQADLIRLLEDNPIRAWTGRGEAERRVFFDYADKRFSTRLSITPEYRVPFQELVRELADWRLAEYLNRDGISEIVEGQFRGKVSSEEGNLIILLSNREQTPWIPRGWIEVNAEGRRIEVNVSDDLIQEAREPGVQKNVLGQVLSDWFGPDAGRAGTSFSVMFEPAGDIYRMQPVDRANEKFNSEPILWDTYHRDQIPKLFGFTFSEAIWNVGFVPASSKCAILLVTLEKGDLPDSHSYEDKFLSDTLFQWKSQNRTSQSSKHGQMLFNHVREGFKIHLFVRPSKKIRSKKAPFYYCGELNFESWHGDRPITIVWKLSQPVPNRLARLFLIGDILLDAE